ncbi:hypothetical protein [Marinicella litoralis]|uniref:Uncharacterized protein n=1 Tax=Marinicella litoralis TaxID=644220 RepID=A0A4R6XM93_9GAMM|nr:hypothetical protein [Marinicella litoralis]TDR20706.1 hypothetical protein C8D91_1684 [Marinicella litoralis]
MKKSILSSITLLSLSFGVASQDLVVSDHLFDANFFPTVIAGVILSLAFQFVLTALSVALGVSTLGNLKQKYAETTQSLSMSGEPNSTETHLTEVDTPVGVKVTGGFGIWSVLTTSIALFLATMIALNLNGIMTKDAVIANSLVIWALFFIILFYFETKIAGTLLGGLISTATAGFKASGSAVKTLFTPSKQKQLDKVIKTTMDRIRTEVNGMDTTAIEDTINAFVKKVDQKIPDYSDLKADLENISKSSNAKPNPVKWMAIEKVLSKAIEKNSKLNSAQAKEKVKQAKLVLAQMKEAYNKGDDSVDGVKNIVSNFSALDKADIDNRMTEFKTQLGKMLPEDFDKKDLKQKLATVINDPKVLVDAANNQFKKLNRQSIVSYLNDNTSIDQAKINEYADKIENVVNQIAAEFDKENEDRMLAKVESSVQNFFNNTGRPELRYEALKNDFVKMMDQPKDSLEIIKSRINQMDNQSFRALITNNPYIDETHIDKVTQSFEDAKQFVSNKIARIEKKSAQQYKIIQRKAVIKAEHARKTASSAAWWLVITAVASAGAAVAGGLF